jgi:hypothetical protein
MLDHCRKTDTDIEEIVSLITGAATTFEQGNAS